MKCVLNFGSKHMWMCTFNVHVIFQCYLVIVEMEGWQKESREGWIPGRQVFPDPADPSHLPGHEGCVSIG